MPEIEIGFKGDLTQRMAAAQLRLLRILALELVPDAVQQLHIALLWVLLQRRDKGPGHGTGSLTTNARILRSLGVFAPRPHDDVCGRSFGLQVALINSVACCSFLEETHSSRRNAAHVATSVRRDNPKQSLTSFFGEVRFFEDALGGVDVGKVEGRAGVAGVEDGGQADAGLQ